MSYEEYVRYHICSASEHYDVLEWKMCHIHASLQINGLNMSEQKFYDYLVIGGVHDGEVFNGPLTRNLEVRLHTQRMAKLYAREEPAETIIPETVTYRVQEHIRGDGYHFFIASNDDLSNFDVEDAIRKAEISPVN